MNERVDADILTEKLIKVVDDTDLNDVLGPYLTQLILPGMVRQHIISQEQFDRVFDAIERTTKEGLTPEQIVQAEKEARRYTARGRISPFAGW